jgi:hypothetical protein
MFHYSSIYNSWDIEPTQSVHHLMNELKNVTYGYSGMIIFLTKKEILSFATWMDWRLC